MASNSINSGIQKTNRQNISNVQPSNVRNDYDRSYPDFMTADFCHVTPFFHEYTVPGDSLRLRPSHIMRTHTLASPLFTNVQGHKAFFSVPMKTILPHTWDRFFVNPTHGDDVPEDVLPNFDVHSLIKELLFGRLYNGSTAVAKTYVGFDTTQKQNPLTSWHWLALTLELINNQNLLSNLGIRSISHFRLLGTTYEFEQGSSETKYYLKVVKTPTDYFNEAIARTISSTVKHGASTLVLMNVPEQQSGNLHTVYWTFDIKTPAGFRALFDFLLTHPGVYMSTSRSTVTATELSSIYSGIVSYDIPVRNSSASSSVTLGAVLQKTFLPSYVIPGQTIQIFPKFNIDRLIAYHMVCAQYFTNSQIDNIYTADLWRQAMMSLWYYAVSNTGETPLPRYTYNGLSLEYDLFSEASLSMILDILVDYNSGSDSNYTSDQIVSLYCFLVNLFTMEKSLVYGDYFTGSRLEPLAVGDTQVRAGSHVDVVDITKGIVMQRFLNKVNRLRSDIVAYSQGIFGITPKSADSIPEYLAALDFGISNEQVDNTAGFQGTIVTNMVSSDSGSFQLTFDSTEDTIVIGVLYFTLPRVYSAGLDRYLFRRTRFDYFQPDLQNVGDQEIYLAEYDPRLCQPNPDDNMNVRAWNAPFSYREQDAEYKQRIGVAAGGFITRSSQLASWANVFDLYRFYRDGSVPELSEDLIRNRNEDFDKFYRSLSNVVPGMYYHFIFAMNNNCEIIRNMFYQPEIL